MRKNIALYCLILVFLTSCVIKQSVVASFPLYLSIKSPAIKTSGEGFYRNGGSYTNLQLYSAGKLVINYESNSLSCLNEKCMSKSTFNKNIFGVSHYSAIMDDILAGAPIYDSKNLVKEEFGFVQKISKKKSFDISYEVREEETIFRDTINGVLIKIKKIKGS